MSLIYKVKTVEAIYESMKQILLGKGSQITNFNIGSRIRTIFEAIASILSQTQYDFSSAVRTAIPLSVFNGFEFERKGGIKASGKLEFTRSSPAGEDYPIPVGTSIILDGVLFTTTQSGNILTGNTSSGQLNAECEQIGSVGNIAVNAINTSIGQGNFVNQPTGTEVCTNPTAFSGGEDEESDEDRIARFRTYINGLARSTVLGMTAGVLSVEGVVSTTIVENLPTPGWITIYADDGTGSLPAPIKTEIEKVINGDPADSVNYPGYRAAGIQVLVIAPSVVTVNVNADIRLLQNSLSTDDDIKDLVTTAIQRYVNTLRLGYDVIRSEIITAAQNAHADVYDLILSQPAANITVGSGEVGRTGTMTLTVTRVNP